MKRRVITNTALLLSLMALTACPDNNRSSNPAATQLQAPPPVNPGGGGIPGNGGVVTNPILQDPKNKGFECDISGRSIKKHFKFFNTDLYEYVPRLTTQNYIFNYDKYSSNGIFDLSYSSHFFGKSYMQFVPAEVDKSHADTLLLANKGLVWGNISISLAGFAGQITAFQINGEWKEGKPFNLYASCKGPAQFAGNVSNAGKTRLVCKGTSSDVGSGWEKIDLDRPLNSIVAGEDFKISQIVTARLDEKRTTITYETKLASEAPVVVATTSIISTSRFDLKDKAHPETGVKVECQLK